MGCFLQREQTSFFIPQVLKHMQCTERFGDELSWVFCLSIVHMVFYCKLLW